LQHTILPPHGALHFHWGNARERRPAARRFGDSAGCLIPTRTIHAYTGGSFIHFRQPVARLYVLRDDMGDSYE
jgi:hypothetical protein